ncbi:MAG TPA: hypothetical protein VNB91_08780, partial [Jatrophihabitantaceae bacterium]|nr:hypothetical protein [Jatrophihabitantaceae bacterium]
MTPGELQRPVQDTVDERIESGTAQPGCAPLLGHIDDVALVVPDRLRAMADVVYTGAEGVMGIPAQWPSDITPIVRPRQQPDWARPSAWSAP